MEAIKCMEYDITKMDFHNLIQTINIHYQINKKPPKEVFEFVTVENGKIKSFATEKEAENASDDGRVEKIQTNVKEIQLWQQSYETRMAQKINTIKQIKLDYLKIIKGVPESKCLSLYDGIETIVEDILFAKYVRDDKYIALYGFSDEIHIDEKENLKQFIRMADMLVVIN